MKDLAKAVCDVVEYSGLDCDWRATQAVIWSLLAISAIFIVSALSVRGRLFRKFLDGLYTFGGVIAALFMIAMLLIIVGQMCARWFGFAFPGSTSYAGYCMAASSFFGLAYALNKGSHIRVNLLLTALGPKRRYGEIWCYAVGAFLATYFTRYAIKATILSEKLNDISQGQDATPLWMPQIAMCLGVALVTIALWDNLFRLILVGDTNVVEESVEGQTAGADA